MYCQTNKRKREGRGRRRERKREDRREERERLRLRERGREGGERRGEKTRIRHMPCMDQPCFDPQHHTGAVRSITGHGLQNKQKGIRKRRVLVPRPRLPGSVPTLTGDRRHEIRNLEQTNWKKDGAWMWRVGTFRERDGVN